MAAPAAFPGLRPLAPGVLLAGAVAILSSFLAAPVAVIFPLPVIVIALLIGIALHPVADRPLFQPGLRFCVSRVLRWAVALLGLRVSLGEIAELGLTTAAIVIASMMVTVAPRRSPAPWGNGRNSARLPAPEPRSAVPRRRSRPRPSSRPMRARKPTWSSS